MSAFLRAAAMLGLAAALAACATSPDASDARARAALLGEFREGRVRLDCGSCRFDFGGAEWMLSNGRHDDLVIAILQSRDGSGRSWYLLGRAAEAAGSPQLALFYYGQSLASPRSPIIPLWPLYEDVTYRIRELSRAPAGTSATASPPAAAPAGKAVEFVTEDAIVMTSRPGQVGAFLAKLKRDDPVEVLDRSGEWEQVRLPDGRSGWVWGPYTAPRTAAASGKPAKANAQTPTPSKPAPATKAVAAAKPSAAPKARAAKATAAAKPAKDAPAAKPAKDEPVAKTASAVAPPPQPAPAAPRVALTRGGALGILGSPLPAGARLAGQSHGAAGNDDHPTETYEVSAGAGDIVGFFEREMERAGWRKSFISSEFLLYFVKEDRTLGVLIERDGGTFTLMGS